MSVRIHMLIAVYKSGIPLNGNQSMVSQPPFCQLVGVATGLAMSTIVEQHIPTTVTRNSSSAGFPLQVVTVAGCTKKW